MTRVEDMSNRERAEAEERIEYVFGFVQDVLDDPSILDRLPESAVIDLVPLERKDPAERYTTETRRFAVKVLRTPADPATEPAAARGRHAGGARRRAGSPAYARRTSGRHELRAPRTTVLRSRRRSA